MMGESEYEASLFPQQASMRSRYGSMWHQCSMNCKETSLAKGDYSFHPNSPSIEPLSIFLQGKVSAE